jgi:hypothetical protein
MDAAHLMSFWVVSVIVAPLAAEVAAAYLDCRH